MKKITLKDLASIGLKKNKTVLQPYYTYAINGEDYHLSNLEFMNCKTLADYVSVLVRYNFSSKIQREYEIKSESTIHQDVFALQNCSEPHLFKNTHFIIQHIGLPVDRNQMQKVIRIYELVKQNKKDATIDDIHRIISKS